jgi:hypothetical protein
MQSDWDVFYPLNASRIHCIRIGSGLLLENGIFKPNRCWCHLAVTNLTTTMAKVVTLGPRIEEIYLSVISVDVGLLLLLLLLL